MKNIALGQYYPTGSVIHRADPRMKLILAVLFIVCTFLCKNIYSFGAILLSAVLLVVVSKIPLKTVLRSIRALMFIMIFTLVINIFMTKGEVLLLEWRFIHIYREGIVNACFMLVRIFALIIGTSILLTYTTTPIALTDAIESLLSPLKKIKLPIHEFAMMMTIALRFIPTLMEETEKIMAAQKARGADFANGSLIKRAKALIPILIPLFVSAFRRADELSVAMECRCYHGGEGRTSMRVLRYRASDFLLLLVFAALCAGLVALNLLKTPFAL